MHLSPSASREALSRSQLSTTSSVAESSKSASERLDGFLAHLREHVDRLQQSTVPVAALDNVQRTSLSTSSLNVSQPASRGTSAPASQSSSPAKPRPKGSVRTSNRDDVLIQARRLASPKKFETVSGATLLPSFAVQVTPAQTQATAVAPAPAPPCAPSASVLRTNDEDLNAYLEANHMLTGGAASLVAMAESKVSSVSVAKKPAKKAAATPSTQSAKPVKPSPPAPRPASATKKVQPKAVAKPSPVVPTPAALESMYSRLHNSGTATSRAAAARNANVNANANASPDRSIRPSTAGHARPAAAPMHSRSTSASRARSRPASAPRAAPKTGAASAKRAPASTSKRSSEHFPEKDDMPVHGDASVDEVAMYALLRERLLSGHPSAHADSIAAFASTSGLSSTSDALAVSTGPLDHADVDDTVISRLLSRASQPIKSTSSLGLNIESLSDLPGVHTLKTPLAAAATVQSPPHRRALSIESDSPAEMQSLAAELARERAAIANRVLAHASPATKVHISLRDPPASQEVHEDDSLYPMNQVFKVDTAPSSLTSTPVKQSPMVQGVSVPLQRQAIDGCIDSFLRRHPNQSTLLLYLLSELATTTLSDAELQSRVFALFPSSAKSPSKRATATLDSPLLRSANQSTGSLHQINSSPMHSVQHTLLTDEQYQQYQQQYQPQATEAISVPSSSTGFDYAECVEDSDAQSDTHYAPHMLHPHWSTAQTDSEHSSPRSLMSRDDETEPRSVAPQRTPTQAVPVASLSSSPTNVGGGNTLAQFLMPSPPPAPAKEVASPIHSADAVNSISVASSVRSSAAFDYAESVTSSLDAPVIPSIYDYAESASSRSDVASDTESEEPHQAEAPAEYDPSCIDDALISEATDMMAAALERAIPDDEDLHVDHSDLFEEDDGAVEVRRRLEHAQIWVDAVWRGLSHFLARRCGGAIDSPLARALHTALVAVSRADVVRAEHTRRQLQRQALAASHGLRQPDPVPTVTRADLRSELVQHVGDLLIDDMMYARFVAQVHDEFDQTAQAAREAFGSSEGFDDSAGNSNEANDAAVAELTDRVQWARQRRAHDLQQLYAHRLERLEEVVNELGGATLMQGGPTGFSTDVKPVESDSQWTDTSRSDSGFGDIYVASALQHDEQGRSDSEHDRLQSLSRQLQAKPHVGQASSTRTALDELHAMMAAPDMQYLNDSDDAHDDVRSQSYSSSVMRTDNDSEGGADLVYPDEEDHVYDEAAYARSQPPVTRQRQASVADSWQDMEFSESDAHSTDSEFDHGAFDRKSNAKAAQQQSPQKAFVRRDTKEPRAPESSLMMQSFDQSAEIRPEDLPDGPLSFDVPYSFSSSAQAERYAADGSAQADLASSLSALIAAHQKMPDAKFPTTKLGREVVDLRTGKTVSESAVTADQHASSRHVSMAQRASGTSERPPVGTAEEVDRAFDRLPEPPSDVRSSTQQMLRVLREQIDHEAEMRGHEVSQEELDYAREYIRRQYGASAPFQYDDEEPEGWHDGEVYEGSDADAYAYYDGDEGSYDLEEDSDEDYAGAR